MDEIKKFYSQRAISIATYFGGPLAAGALIWKNYQVLNKPEQAKTALYIGILATVILFSGIFFIPERIIDKVPNALIPGIYTIIIYYIVERIQGKELKLHKETGGEFHSGWKAAGVGAISLLVIAVFIASVAFIAGDFSFSDDFDAETYDKGIAKFAANEKRAVAVFDVIETADSKYLLKEFSKGQVIWTENREIIARLSLIENLPKVLINQNERLAKYCDLRMKHNELLIKAISEDTDQYTPEIERIGEQINDVLEQLE